jgi:hypothetical protein
MSTRAFIWKWYEQRAADRLRLVSRYTVRSYSIFNISMYGKVKRLRDHGRRLSNREINQMAAIEGALTLAAVRSTYILQVRRHDSQVGPGLLPDLYEARLVAMHTGGMLFRGEERPQGDEGPAYVQEWSVMIGAL